MDEIFYWLSIEELIHSRQQEYYHVLGKSDWESEQPEPKIPTKLTAYWA
jgi:hypothetical protein